MVLIGLTVLVSPALLAQTFDCPTWSIGKWWDIDSSFDVVISGELPAELTFHEVDCRLSVFGIENRTLTHGSHASHQVYILRYSGLLHGEGAIRYDGGPFPFYFQVRIPDTTVTGEIWIDTQTLSLVAWSRDLTGRLESIQGTAWEDIGEIRMNPTIEYDPKWDPYTFPITVGDIWLGGTDVYTFGDYRIALELFSPDVIDQQIVIQRMGIDPEEFSGFDPSLRVWFNENLSEALYTTPAELGLMLEFTILLFAALTFSRERELGTLESLLVMPFSSLEIIIGKSIPVIIVGFLDFLLMLGMVHFAFGVPVRGSLPLLLILAFGYLLVELGKGLVISVISRTQHQAFLLVMLVGMVDFMFTGYAAPVEGMPQVLQWIANLIPAHHWLNILRSILLKGAGLDVIWYNVFALIILGLVIGIFSLRYVRKALD